MVPILITTRSNANRGLRGFTKPLRTTPAPLGRRGLPIPIRRANHDGMTTRAVGYIRVSQAREDMISPELQRHQIEQFAIGRGIEVVEFLEDLDESGRRFTKRKVAAIIEGVRAGTYDAVILWKWSRWGRNLRESLTYLAQAEDAGAIVFAATEDIDPKTSMGKFSRDQLLLIAELQSNQMSDGWKEVHDRRRRLGLPHGGKPRMGYLYVRDDFGPRFEVDTETADLVREGYERIVSGESLRAVTLDWNRRGVKTTQGKQWTPGSFGRMLDTGFAAGLLRERSDPSRSAPRGMADYDIWREGAQQPIIDRDLWERYKAARQASVGKAPKRCPAGIRPLTGLVFCSWCGRSMSSYHNNKTTVSWRCSMSSTIGYDDHPSVAISEKKIVTALWDWFEHGAGLWDAPAPSPTEAVAAIDQLQTQLHELTRRRSQLAEGWVDGLFERGDYVRLKAETDAAIQRIQIDLHEKQSGPQPQPMPVAERLQITTGLHAIWESMSPPEQNTTLRRIVARVIVRAGQSKDLHKKLIIVPTPTLSELQTP